MLLLKFAAGSCIGRHSTSVGSGDQGTQHHSGPEAGIASLAISSDGQTLAIAGKDKIVTLRSTITGKTLSTLPAQTAPVVSFAFSADGKIMATCNKDKLVKLWNVSAGTELTHESHTGKGIFSLTGGKADIGLMAISADSQITVAHVAQGRDGNDNWAEVRLLDVASGKYRVLARALSPLGLPGIGANYTPLAFSPDGKTLVVGNMGAGGEAQLIVLNTLVPNSKNITIDIPSLNRAFSTDGRILAAAGEGQFIFWNLATGKVLSTSQLAAPFAAISADMRTLVSLDGQNSVKLWELNLKFPFPIGPGMARLKGMKDALADLERSRLQLKEFPLPAPGWFPAYLELLRKECGVEWQSVRFEDVLQEGTNPRAELDGYNDLMRVEIEHRHGPGILSKLRERAESLKR